MCVGMVYSIYIGSSVSSHFHEQGQVTITDSWIRGIVALQRETIAALLPPPPIPVTTWLLHSAHCVVLRQGDEVRGGQESIQAPPVGQEGT